MSALDLATLGEGQLRLTAPVGETLRDATSLAAYVAGTEANVACLLAQLGRRAGFVTALPDTALGRRVTDTVRSYGVDVSRVRWRPDGRVALYFVEQRVRPFASDVLYDRQHSVFTQMRPDEVDWAYLTGARMVHLSGITPAIGPGPRTLVERALAEARTAGQLVSFDINYRRRLWSPSQAAGWLKHHLVSPDVLLCPRRDAELLGLTGAPGAVAAGLADQFGARTVVVSDGPRPVHCLHDGELTSLPVPETEMLDRIGAGDALVGGFLHGFLAGDVESGVRLGVAAATVALTRRGDQLRISEQELTRLANGDTGHDIER